MGGRSAVGRRCTPAKPSDSLLWDALSDWTDEFALGEMLRQTFPSVEDEERAEALAHALAVLAEEKLLEFGES